MTWLPIGEFLRVAPRLCDRAETLVAADLGVVHYDAALRLQEALRDHRIRGEVPDLLLLQEHSPVYTLGRAATLDHLGAAATGTVPVRRVGRGGYATFHGPGQLVGYPIIDLSHRGADVHAYLRCLESALIRAVGGCGVAAGRIAGRPGVWVERRKLGSIGIGVRRWVTTHGFALNVSTDLAYFDAIVPCGLSGVRMTSLLAEGSRPDRRSLEACVARALAEELGYRTVRWVGNRAETASTLDPLHEGGPLTSLQPSDPRQTRSRSR